MLDRDLVIVPLMELISISNVSRDVSSDISVVMVPDRPLMAGTSQVTITRAQKYDGSNNS